MMKYFDHSVYTLFKEVVVMMERFLKFRVSDID